MNKVNEIDPIPKIKQKCTSRISNIYIYISSAHTDGQIHPVEYLDIWDNSNVLMTFDMQWQY